MSAAGASRSVLESVTVTLNHGIKIRMWLTKTVLALAIIFIYSKITLFIRCSLNKLVKAAHYRKKKFELITSVSVCDDWFGLV